MYGQCERDFLRDLLHHRRGRRRGSARWRCRALSRHCLELSSVTRNLPVLAWLWLIRLLRGRSGRASCAGGRTRYSDLIGAVEIDGGDQVRPSDPGLKVSDCIGTRRRALDLQRLSEAKNEVR
jgi:hypothetical protein